MRWRGERQSSNVEDRRGFSGGKVAVGGGLGTVLIIIIALIFGADPRQLLEQVPSDPSSGVQSSRPVNTEEDQLKQYVSVVLAKSEDVWNNLIQQNGRQYREPTLVLFPTTTPTLQAEVLPAVEKNANVKLTRKADGRAVMGCSSGAAAALTMARYHPEWYHRVIS